jgi:sugar lactone lactonase YvrE
VTHPNGHTLTGSDGSSIETDLLELHHLRWPWAVDTGSKRYVHGPEFETVRRDGRVVRLDDGFGLPRPYPTETKYSPTAVAVDPRGCVWVADGYGQSLVHRYTSAGELDLTLDGFVTPHSVAIVDGLVLVCDRGNGRIQEYDLDGNLLRTLAQGVVVTPTDLVAVDDRLVVTDFTAGRITVLTRDGELVEHLCTSERSPDEDGWPNMRDGGGNLVRPETTPGVVNSPHTLAADENGDLYVTEWLIGGRVTKLARYRGGTWISD